MSSTGFEVVKEFEKQVCQYTGAKYAVAVDSCCNALFLSCKYLNVKRVHIPSNTYPGVACAIINAGGKIGFENQWDQHMELSLYQLKPYNIYDGALALRQDICTELDLKDYYYCLSFHSKKHLPIGRGGMILTDNQKAYDWFKKARFDGRSECPLDQDKISMVGWNMYMTPEQAARGLVLLNVIKSKSQPYLYWTLQGYPDLRNIKAYQ